MVQYDVRLQTGQTALHRPRSLVGHAVALLQWQWPCWYPLSHAAPVWVLDEPVWLPHAGKAIGPGAYTVDAVGGGLVAQQVQAWVRSGASIIIRDVPPKVRAKVTPHILAERAEVWFQDNIGRVKYDHLRLLRFLWRCPTGWRPNGETGSKALSSTVCSAWSSRTTFELFDFDDVPDYRRYWTTPSDLAATRELVTLSWELRFVA